MNIQSISTSLPPQSSLETIGASHAPRETKVATLAQEKTTPAQSTQPVDLKQLDAAVKSVREYIEPINNALEFSLNDDTDQVVVKIVDRETKEVIRQMPSEEMIAIAKALDTLKGLFLRQKA